jgi:hypothetical protein
MLPRVFTIILLPTPSQIAKQLVDLAKQIDSKLYYSPDPDPLLPGLENTFEMIRSQLTSLTPDNLVTWAAIQGNNKIESNIRKFWRLTAKQLFTFRDHPKFIQCYLDKVIPLFFGQPQPSSSSIPRTLAEVFQPDLSSLPLDLRVRYQTELNLPLRG